MKHIHDDLREIARATTILGADRYRMLGDERLIPSKDGTATQPMLLRSVESEMYYRLYRRPRAPAARGGTGSSVDTMRGFAFALSAANCGQGTWDPGWHVVGAEASGDLVVLRDEVRYRVSPEDVRRGGDGACRVRVRKELRQLVRAFYMALGDADWPSNLQRPGAIVRLYWHLQPHAAPLYLAEVTSRLNARGVPFRTKVLNDPEMYAGADAGVLYVPSPHIGPLWPDIRAIHGLVGAGLRPSVPMFSHRLAPGLGYAEDPGDGTSFGQARSRVAAQGLWCAFAAGENDEAGRMAHLAGAFKEAGINPDAPFRSEDTDCPPAPISFSR